MEKNKESINSRLRAFNSWFDEFILVVAKPLAMLGFAMGTVDIFVRGSLATNYAFALLWAVVQALTIDGLFFAVWWRIFAMEWVPGKRGGMVGLIAIGVILSAVAMLTNSIIGLQQLWGLSDSQQAMIRLGISPFWFSLARAALVVAVSTMVAFVTYKSNETENAVRANEKTAIMSENANENQVRIDEVRVLSLASPRDKQVGDEILTGEKVREAAREAVRNDKSLNLNQFSRETGIPVSTMYRWRKEAQ